MVVALNRRVGVMDLSSSRTRRTPAMPAPVASSGATPGPNTLHMSRHPRASTSPSIDRLTMPSLSQSRSISWQISNICLYTGILEPLFLMRLSYCVSFLRIDFVFSDAPED